MGMGGALGQTLQSIGSGTGAQAPSQSTGQTPAPAGKGGVIGQVGQAINGGNYVNPNLNQPMGQTAPRGVIGQLGQVATGQQPAQGVPEWVKLAQASGGMQNPYAPQQSPGFGPGVDNFAPPSFAQQLQSMGPYGQSGMIGQLGQERAQVQPPQGGFRPLTPPDTSQQAFNQFMAQVKFAPGAQMPTYDQWAQDRTNAYQQAQQFQQMTPEQQQAFFAQQRAQAPAKLDTMPPTPGMGQLGGGFNAPMPSQDQLRAMLGGMTPQGAISEAGTLRPLMPGMPLKEGMGQLGGGFDRPMPGMPTRGFPQQGMPTRGFPGQRPMPFPQQGGAGDRTPLQGNQQAGLAALLQRLRNR